LRSHIAAFEREELLKYKADKAAATAAGVAPPAAPSTAVAAGASGAAAGDFESCLYGMCPNNCSTKMSRITHIAHILGQCPRTPSACRFCGKPLATISAKMHGSAPTTWPPHTRDNTCCSHREMLPIACKYCSKKLLFRDKLSHEESCGRSFDAYIRDKDERREAQLRVEANEAKAKADRDRADRERDFGRGGEFKGDGHHGHPHGAPVPRGAPLQAEGKGVAAVQHGPQLPAGHLPSGTGTGTGGGGTGECPVCSKSFPQGIQLEQHVDACLAAMGA